jgi:mono/diheme cytochrome c family protein
MSPSDSHGDHNAHDDHEHHRSWLFYTAIAVFLGFLTLIEIGPLFEWFELPALVLIALSVVKFFFVVAFFMHLWDDPPIFTRVFVAPLIGGILMVMVLMALFSTWFPSAKEDSFAVQERYWTNFNGQCNSWLVSSVSNRTYCASGGCSGEDLANGLCNPDLDKDRVVMHYAGADDAAGPAFVLPDDEAEAKAVLIEEGQKLYEVQCASCHQKNGQGVSGAFPPLAGSDYEGYLEKAGHVNIILNGLNGRIVVNGTEYNGNMAGFSQLSDLEIAAIATYERNAWGNDHGVVMPDLVKAGR